MNNLEEKLKFINKISFRGPIGFFIVAAGFGFLFILVYKTVPPENKEIVIFSAGLVLGMMKEVSGFFFGSSKDKADSDKAAHVKELLDDTPAPVNNNTTV